MRLHIIAKKYYYNIDPVCPPQNLIPTTDHRNVSVISSGVDVYEEKYSTSRVLTMIQTVSETTLMMILQIYILLQSWRFSCKTYFYPWIVAFFLLQSI
jgi:hypothetical protein